MGRAAVLAVATCRPAPVATADDALGLSRLAGRADVVVETIPWDARPDWSRYDAVVIRSTWDYHMRLDSFLHWADEVEASGTELWNPAAVVRWNSDKRYLGELERAGVPVVPTEWIRRGSRADLGRVRRDRGWPRVVVKPSVAATAYRTGRIDNGNEDEGCRLLSSILQETDALAQPFLPEVCDQGEWSFIYFEGGSGGLDFSHAVLKRARPGDFRVQPQFGGTTHLVTPPQGIGRQADEVARVIDRLAPAPLLYARIDGVVSAGHHAPKGVFLLMEAELIEPMLFLQESEQGVDRFAEAVARRIGLPEPRSS